MTCLQTLLACKACKVTSYSVRFLIIQIPEIADDVLVLKVNTTIGAPCAPMHRIQFIQTSDTVLFLRPGLGIQILDPSRTNLIVLALVLRALVACFA